MGEELYFTFKPNIPLFQSSNIPNFYIPSFKGSSIPDLVDEEQKVSPADSFLLFDFGVPHLLRGKRDPPSPSPPEGAEPDQGEECKVSGGESKVEGRGKAIAARKALYRGDRSKGIGNGQRGGDHLPV